MKNLNPFYIIPIITCIFFLATTALLLWEWAGNNPKLAIWFASGILTIIFSWIAINLKKEKPDDKSQ